MPRKPRKKPYRPKSFESSKGTGDVSANLYASMLQSHAWQQLTNNARVLYMYIKLQYYGAKPIEDQDPRNFYFNWKLIEMYGLYNNKNSFQRDKKLLIQWGFIEQVESGKCTRTKNIYQFSDRWQSL